MNQRRGDRGEARTYIIVGCAVVAVAALSLAAWFAPGGSIQYGSQLADLVIETTDQIALVLEAGSQAELSEPEEPKFVATHVPTPDQVKAVYMTSWAAGHPKFRAHLFDLVDTTEINSVVIDVKDYTGRVSFHMENELVANSGAAENRIPDIRDLIAQLHDRGVYVIARISVFQDSYLVGIHPEWAVKTKSGEVWKDYKGIKWLDAAARPVWEYTAAIGKEAYEVGFDELNFDYIRFPSDGNLEDIAYTWSEGRTRYEVMKDFYEYIHDEFSGTGIPTSADLFGLTTSAEGDLGIGQILEYGLKYFDFVAPMVYPSHYGAGFAGFAKPAQYPYEVIKRAMEDGIVKALATSTRIHWLGVAEIASTTPQLYEKETYDHKKLRPWLQAFDLGATYTPEMVRAQIQATYDVGLDSWMLWNAGSLYDKRALEVKDHDSEIGRP